MNQKTFLLSLALSLLYISTANAADLQDILDRQYKQHIFSVRYAITPGEQDFDSTGHPLNSSSGSWSVYGGFLVHHLGLAPDTLRVEGTRVALIDDDKSKKPMVMMLEKDVRIQIRLDHPLESLTDAQALLGKVFFLDDDHFQHAKPEFRRADYREDEPVFHPGKDGTKAPKATYTPEPDYSDKARRERFEGIVVLSIVVDKAGRVAKIRIEKPLGMGLDENAVESVKTWRFKPPIRDDKPVAIEMRIEVAFNLLDRRP